MKKTQSFVFVVALSQSLALAAEEPNWYVGIAGGATKVADFPTPDDIRAAVVEEIAIGNANFPGENSQDDSDTFWKVFGGYQFNPHIGLEVFYADLGAASAKWSATDLSGFPFFSGGKLGGAVDYSASTIGMYLVASYPFASGLRIYGKVGAHYYDSELRTETFSSGVLYPQTSVTETLDETGSGVALGAGLGYDISPRWGVTVDWERFDGVSFEGFDLATDALSAGLVYRF